MMARCYSGTLGASSFPTFVLQVRKNPEKTSPRKLVPTGDQTWNPLCDRRACCRLAHIDGPIYRIYTYIYLFIYRIPMFTHLSVPKVLFFFSTRPCHSSLLPLVLLFSSPSLFSASRYFGVYHFLFSQVDTNAAVCR